MKFFILIYDPANCMSLNEENPGPFVWFSTLQCRHFGIESVSYSGITWQEIDLIHDLANRASRNRAQMLISLYYFPSLVSRDESLAGLFRLFIYGTLPTTRCLALSSEYPPFCDGRTHTDQSNWPRRENYVFAFTVTFPPSLAWVPDLPHLYRLGRVLQRRTLVPS